MQALLVGAIHVRDCLLAQGGEGCRDKKMMDRRDGAKYRNSKHKSVSKKASRVGKEGAARRQRGQKADK